MKLRKYALILMSMLTVALCTPLTALADGIIIPDPPICDPGPCPPPFLPMAQLEIRYHKVTVEIDNQVAVTHVDQVFYNPNNWTIEGTYIFPIPVDAVVSNFTLWIDGKPVEGKVLSAEEARRTYEEIVQSMRDPALLEYVDRGAVQARIFPIDSHSERRIELEYSQVLTAENGLVRYVYPLSTEKFSRTPLESVSVNVDIVSQTPIRAVYSPSHDIDLSRQDDHHVIAGYEDENITPDSDFVLYYSLGDSEAFHLLTYRDPTDPVDADGFFLLLLAPKPEADVDTLEKDVILVLDRSGSMEGDKFSQAQEALRYVLNHLNRNDRFNIISFSTGIDTYSLNMQSISKVESALDWVDHQSARGSTDINLALLEAASIADKERPTYLIFLTDGLPTIGETDSQKILDNLAREAGKNIRLFAFGVGYDVDTFLLDLLAQEHHGASTYVLPGEPLNEVISTFYEKISTPVLTDLEIDFGDLAEYDVYPEPLPDLFAGSQIIVMGRYRDGGIETVVLSGYVNEDHQTFRFPDQIFDTDSRGDAKALAVLPRLWATRKIGYLLNRVRLNGPDEETINQIVKLSIRYGIVTPYTSYLVTEEMALGQAEQERLAEGQMDEFKVMAEAPTYGEEAVRQAADQGQMAGANSVQAPASDVTNVVRIVGSRTFVMLEGKWVDTAFDPDRMQTIKVGFLTDDYFKLSQSRPDIGAAFALGEQVIVLSDGIAYEVVEANANLSPIEVPPTYTAKPDKPVVDVTPVVVTSAAATPIAAASTLDVPAPTPTPVSGDEPDDPSSRQSGPCASAMLPLGVVAMGLFVRRRHRN
jgi:Ca-activated chloride channel family protein